MIGYSGHISNSFFKHPDGKHLVYILGSTIVINDVTKSTSSKEFLLGHSNNISCMDISKSGKYIASSQVTHMGFQADIIVWDFEKRSQYRKFSIHKGKVQSLAFSSDEQYLITLGGQDDNTIVVWDIEKGKAICGVPASKDSDGIALSVSPYNQHENCFASCGISTLRVWEFDAEKRKAQMYDINMGPIKRVIECCVVDANDEYMYCGTTTGDLLKVNLSTKLFRQSGPPKEKFSLGIISILLVPGTDKVIVGSGDGTVALMKTTGKMNIISKVKIEGKVTSLCFDNQKRILAGTSTSSLYMIDLKTFEATLKNTCHFSEVNDVCFPQNCSTIFATASDNDIRIWNIANCEELLRITVPNLHCKCLTFNKDGNSLITGWDDGKIRAFGPQSGRLQWEINDAHKKCVTAVTVSNVINEYHDYKIISGGDDGCVRVWGITKNYQVLENNLKEHKGTVTCIKIKKNDKECVSSSADGSTIFWDLERHIRSQVVFAPSFLKAVVYYPDESQILTSGTDRKVAYWESFDGSLIREIEASQSDAINGLDITTDGKFFVCGGSDKLVKVYRYEEGDSVYIGVGHSTEITKVIMSPDQQNIVSISAEGAIYIWEFPEKIDLHAFDGIEEEQSLLLHNSITN
ncbi:WD40 repeat-like protein [Neocallimastix californiae]|jgi:WD40 repeat protein|uniref:Cilia- and flagella-associated protein 52 n=1 Tax=Neocallimastix californiae TaxID=1754190 RepID=A0A1Y1YXQ9_9FUNG|nr:WD40 repeat-like protein [Neocallimastix californiae]|eukprot:ORY02769.1 WD40 repeat-like protein [Neocallimastix californiae]